MKARLCERDRLLSALDVTVASAEDLFRGTDERLCEGGQTAREVLAHLVFWHLEYVHVAESLVAGRPYALRHATLTELNELAARQLRDEPMPVLARRLSYRQKHLAKQLRQLPDWSTDFPVKADSSFCSVAERVHHIERHIRGHVERLRQAVKNIEPSAGALSLGTVDAFALPAASRYFLRMGPISVS